MEIYRILRELELDKCYVRAIQQVDKRVLNDAKFNIDQYVKKGMSVRIGEEILKKEDVIEDNTDFDSFHKCYRSEVFVFTRSELNKLIKKLTETSNGKDSF